MIVAFAGLKGSGKDTAADLLVREYGFVKVAFADAVRTMALVINPVVPVPHNYGREYISDLTSLVPERLADLVSVFGWDKLKRDIPEVRRLLQAIGTDAVRDILGPTVWIDTLVSNYPDIMDEDTRYVISDCRFLNEAEFINNAQGLLCWISRPSLNVVSDSHISESSQVRYSDFVQCEIVNNASLAEFYQQIHEFMEAEGFTRGQ